jgi:hypothetical protein
MHRYIFVVLCFTGLFATGVSAQKSSAERISVSAGAVLTFHLQTRLDPRSTNEMDNLPRGTVLRVRMLEAIDSGVNHDGAEFRGQIVAPVFSGKETVLHSDSEVTGLLALLRSRNHPEGFRYELLITRVSDHGKAYVLTASLNPSMADVPAVEPRNDRLSRR